MTNKKEPKDMTIGEFMEFYVSEYDNATVLPSDFTITKNKLQGYALGKKGEGEEFFLLRSSCELLQNSENFFSAVKRYTDWKFKG